MPVPRTTTMSTPAVPSLVLGRSCNWIAILELVASEPSVVERITAVPDSLSPRTATRLTQRQSASAPAQQVTHDETDNNDEQCDGMVQYDFHNIWHIEYWSE
jgi:hypothetical protein